MTREEFRDYVDFLRSQDEISYDVYSGLIDAIDTLEQEPKIVPIAVIKFDDDMLHEIVKEAVKNIEIEPKWIPVSEPPKELGTYLIQTDGEPYMRQCRWTDVNPFWTDYKTKPHWNIFDLPQYSKVVAWMPLPKPYEPKKSEDKCKNCEYYHNPDYTRCHECETKRSNK